MKANVILLVDADGDSVGFVLEAAARTGRGVRVARTRDDALKVLKSRFRSIDALIIDADPVADALALLAQISCSEQALPLLVICAADTYMKTMVARERAAACLCKPVSIEQLRSTIDRILIEAYDGVLTPQQVAIVAGRPEPLRSESFPAPNCESTALGLAVRA
jgi:DNA-binding response OmpR family regulator